MEMELNLEILNVYGGDGVVRPHKVESVKLSRSRTKTRTRVDIGVPVESEFQETAKELKDDVCQTFKRDEDGTPLLRLGGSHGKFWGSLKSAAELLKESKGTFGSFSEIERTMRAINVLPLYVRLENAEPMFVDSLPQVLSGRRSSMITIHYDVIPKCEAKLKIVFPDVYENKLKEMLNQVQEMGTLNKRRSTIRVINLEQ